MLILLVYDNVLFPFVDELYKTYVPSSRGSLDWNSKAADVVAMYGKSPLFNDGWLLECSNAVKPSSIGKLERVNPNNCLVYSTRSKEELNKLANKFSDFHVEVVDNHDVPREDVIVWIMKELKCAGSTADLVYTRAGGRLENIMAGVNTLSLLDHVRATDVRLYVEKSHKVFVSDIAKWILGITRPGVKREDLMQLVYDFRYAQSWLLQEINNQLSLYLKIFTLAADGTLTLKNYKEYKSITSDGKIRDLPEYSLLKILQCFGTVSLEYLYYVKEVCSSIAKNDRTGMYKLIQLIKLGGK